MRYEIPDIKLTKNQNIIFALLALLGIVFSIYVFIHTAQVSGVVTEQQVVIDKDTKESKILFKVNNKEFIFQDKVTELTEPENENEPITDYKLAKVNFNIGDTIKVNYKDAYYDKKPTYNGKNMQFKVISAAQTPFKVIEGQAMDLVEKYNDSNLKKDSDTLKNMIHPDSKVSLTFSDVPENLDLNNIEWKFINPKFKLLNDTYELSVRVDLLSNHDGKTERIQKTKTKYTLKFDGENLKIYSVETESAK